MRIIKPKGHQALITLNQKLARSASIVLNGMKNNIVYLKSVL